MWFFCNLQDLLAKTCRHICNPDRNGISNLIIVVLANKNLVNCKKPHSLSQTYTVKTRSLSQEQKGFENECQVRISNINKNYLNLFQEHIKNREEKGFIRSLTESILDNCIEKTNGDGSYQLNRQKLEKCSPLLTQFVDNIEEREVQCLHAIRQRIVELEHPSGCLQDILTCLYDIFALSKEGFLKWRDDTDPHEQEGKGKIYLFDLSSMFLSKILLTGVALKSCTPFIQFLGQVHENDDDSTGDEN
jgi:hypothetical protein